MRSIKENVMKNIWLYLAWILLVITLWVWVFQLLTKLRPEEKVIVFAGTYSYSFDAEEYLNDKERRPEYLKAIDVTTHTLREEYFASTLEVFGHDEADILILPESKIDGAWRHFSPISENYQEMFAKEELALGWYKEDGQVYGLQVRNKDTKESLISGLDYDFAGCEEENFYLFFNKNSLHLSDLAHKNNKNTMDAAITVAKWLLML